MDSKVRFDGRAEAYDAYRPSYPNDIASALLQSGYLRDGATIVDLGSGTGKLAELLVPHCRVMYGVEPNDDMRRIAEKNLGHSDVFCSVNACAENTSLANKSIDLIVCGQSLHWFDSQTTHSECKRILRQGGAFCAVWNNRRTDDGFAAVYDELLLKHCPDYKDSSHKSYDRQKMVRWIAKDTLVEKVFYYEQFFTLDQLKLRAVTASYVPKEGPNHSVLMGAIDAAFQKLADNGRVKFVYDTLFYCGRITSTFDERPAAGAV